MNPTSFEKLTLNSRIGISPDSGVNDDTDTSDKYAEFEMKRLTKASSFMAHGEIFYIGKKNPTGKATKIYHVYRVSDKKYVCPSVLDKEDTMMYVIKKYGDYLDELEA